MGRRRILLTHVGGIFSGTTPAQKRASWHSGTAGRTWPRSLAGLPPRWPGCSGTTAGRAVRTRVGPAAWPHQHDHV